MEINSGFFLTENLLRQISEQEKNDGVYSLLVGRLIFISRQVHNSFEELVESSLKEDLGTSNRADILRELLKFSAQNQARIVSGLKALDFPEADYSSLQLREHSADIVEFVAKTAPNMGDKDSILVEKLEKRIQEFSHVANEAKSLIMQEAEKKWTQDSEEFKAFANYYCKELAKIAGAVTIFLTVAYMP